MLLFLVLDTSETYFSVLRIKGMTYIMCLLRVCVCLRLFGVTGNCAACSKLIPAFEMVMRAKENVYHLDCFACQLCNQR